MALLGSEEIEAKLADLDGWERRGDAIVKAFERGDFVGSVRFVDSLVAPAAVDAAISLARNAGTVSGIGVQVGKSEMNLGLAWLKGLDLRLGQANVIAHVDAVLALLESGKLDPTPLVTHHMKLDDAVEAYDIYDRREALKIVLEP